MVFAQQPSKEQQDLAKAMGPPPKPPKKKGLFGGGLNFELGGSKKKPDIPDHSIALSQEVNSIGRRLRLLEDRTQTMREKVSLIDQNMLETHKKLLTEIKTTNQDIVDVKQKLSEVENKIVLLIKELRLCAKKEEVDVMIKYMDLWQPQNFVSHDQVEQMVRRIVEEYTQ